MFVLCSCDLGAYEHGASKTDVGRASLAIRYVRPLFVCVWQSTPVSQANARLPRACLHSACLQATDDLTEEWGMESVLQPL